LGLDGKANSIAHHIIMSPISLILPCVLGLLLGIGLLPFTIWLVFWLAG